MSTGPRPPAAPTTGSPCLGVAARSADGPLELWEFKRRELQPDDVKITVSHCGICHSDLHTVRGEWGPAYYPLCPGHEVVGRVAAVGSAVTRFKVGDAAGVGVMVRSCGACSACADDLEQYCADKVWTYGSKDPADGTVTQGGYTTSIVTQEHFCLKWPEGLPMDAGAPLLCAGITTYSPLRHFKMDRPGQRIGVVGLGGLGHMAIKFIKAFGGQPVVISRTGAKRAEATRHLGAVDFVVSSDSDSMAAAAGSLDGIIDTVSAKHSLEAMLALLKPSCTMCLVGLPPDKMDISSAALVGRRASLAGSLIGGIKQTQEMLDFCAAKGITADVEVIKASYVNEAYERMLRGDVRYRFVIDVAGSMKNPDAAAALAALKI